MFHSGENFDWAAGEAGPWPIGTLLTEGYGVRLSGR